LWSTGQQARSNTSAALFNSLPTGGLGHPGYNSRLLSLNTMSLSRSSPLTLVSPGHVIRPNEECTTVKSLTVARCSLEKFCMLLMEGIVEYSARVSFGQASNTFSFEALCAFCFFVEFTFLEFIAVSLSSVASRLFGSLFSVPASLCPFSSAHAMSAAAELKAFGWSSLSRPRRLPTSVLA